MTISQPEINKLPLLSLAAEKLFYLKIEHVIEIFKCLLLETRIIVFSSDKMGLSSLIETFINLIYPLKYSSPYITILPLDNYSIIENFNSFFIGINLTYTNDFFDKYNLDIGYTPILIVDFDNKNIKYYSRKENCNYITLENINENKISIDTEVKDLEFPYNIKKRLSDKLHGYLKELKSSDKRENRENFINTIREIFYYTMISLLHDYARFMAINDQDFYNLSNKISNSKTYKKLVINDIFKLDEFLLNVVQLEKSFYKKLFETNNVFNFIYKKMFPKDNSEKMEIVFFDESIAEKNNRSIFCKNVKYIYFIKSY
jgi:hypothetical protein